MHSKNATALQICESAGVTKWSNVIGLGPIGLVPSKVRILSPALVNLSIARQDLSNPNLFRINMVAEIVAKRVAKIITALKKDVLALIWIAFIVSIVVMTVWFQSSLKDIIIISVLFILFYYFEPIILNPKGIITLLGVRFAPRWKTFPIFFIGIILIYFGYVFLQEILTRTLPTGGINIVFVAIWLMLLFVMYDYKILMQ